MDTISVFVLLFLFASMKCGIASTTTTDLMDYPENNEVPLAEMNPMLDNELERLSDMLMSVLKQSWGPAGVPLVYLEEVDEKNTNPESDGDGDGDNGFAGPPLKRSRYYRRYPWKRQNSRSRTRYEVDNRYMCQPSREDVFKLLVALHETRAGNLGKSIQFCNRRRSAGAIFTNIRFLGKK